MFMLDKEKLSCDHEIALTNLIEFVRDLGLFLDNDGDFLHTCKILKSASFLKNDWLLCLDSIGEDGKTRAERKNG